MRSKAERRSEEKWAKMKQEEMESFFFFFLKVVDFFSHLVSGIFLIYFLGNYHFFLGLRS